MKKRVKPTHFGAKWKAPFILSIAMLMINLSSKAAEPDLQIDQLIRRAIDAHPLVQSARAGQKATTEGITAAKLNLLPTPSVSSGYDQDRDFVSQLTIRQPLWTGGRLTADVNQAIFDDKAAVEAIFEQQNTVAKTTIDAWQSYVQAVAKQGIHLDSLKQLNDFEAMMQRRVGQGVSARIELDLVTNRILQEQTAYQAAVEQERIASARLEQMIGTAVSQQHGLRPNIEQMAQLAKAQSVGFDKLAFDQAGFYNPTVVKEHFQIESAKQGVEAKRAARFPTVYAQYENTYARDDDKRDGMLSIGLSYAPGAGFSNLALARASQAQVESLVQNQEAARRQVMEEIQVQYQQFASARDREASLIAAAAGAQIVVESYKRQFIAGRKSWLEVLNAVREQSDYQVQLAQTRAEMIGAFYRLQVDFGLMPWQQFAKNRQAVTLFDPIDSAKDWVSQKTDKVAKIDNNGFIIDASQDNPSAPDVIEIQLPADAEARLNRGERILLNDDYTMMPTAQSVNDSRPLAIENDYEKGD